MTNGINPDELESIRGAMLGAESAVKSLGWLCWLVAGLLVLVAVPTALMAIGAIDRPAEFVRFFGPDFAPLVLWAVVGFDLLASLAHLGIGYGLIRLREWARWTVVVLTGLSLVSGVVFCLAVATARVAVGLLSLAGAVSVHLLIAYPLLTPRSAVVFSDSYRDLVRRTPQIRAQVHPLLWVLIGLIVLGLLGFVGYIAGILLGIFD